MFSIICLILYVLYYMSYIKCLILYVLYYMSYIICLILYVLYYMPYIICLILYVFYYMSCIKCLILKAKKLIKAYMKSTECLKNRIMKKQSHLKIQFHKTGYNKTHLESLQERLPYEEMQHVNITLPCVAISSGNRRRQMRV